MRFRDPPFIKWINMPNKPMNPCRIPGCPNLTNHRRGYCDEHLTQKYREEDANRKSPGRELYDWRWHKASRMYLHRHSLCAECLEEGITTVATVVDHIIPHHGDPELFWDESNWQPLCKMHHDRKTAKERK